MTEAPHPISLRTVAVWLAISLALAACESVTTGPADPPPEPGVLEATRDGPSDAAPGTCWGRTVSPAVIETVTRQVLVKPAEVNPDGTIAAPPVYRSETDQQIVTARVDNWFETPCQEVLTPEFNASLQRALSARGFYAGEITGEMDTATRTAVEAYQRTQGLDSAVLSLATARSLGLVAVPRTPVE